MCNPLVRTVVHACLAEEPNTSAEHASVQQMSMHRFIFTIVKRPALVRRSASVHVADQPDRGDSQRRFTATNVPGVMLCIYNGDAVFDWDESNGGIEGSKPMKKTIQLPRFASEDEEATWWASRPGRDFLKQKSAELQKKMPKGLRLVGQLSRTKSVQIALRLPSPDVEKARELATRKGIGYQTLLKMLVHEGLRREAKRA